MCCIAAYIMAGCASTRDAPATAATDSAAIKVTNPNCVFYCTNTATFNAVDAKSDTRDAPSAKKEGEPDSAVTMPTPKRGVRKPAKPEN